MRPAQLLILFAVLAAGSLALGLLAGSVPISIAQLWPSLIGGEATGPVHDIIFTVRLPRVLGGFACGGLLALAGALLQVLLRNPLADPYVLGLSGGAACGALVALLAGASALVTSGAFAGALVSTAIVFGLARGNGAWAPTQLLLTGVVVATGWGALIMLILTTAPEAQVRGMLFWLIGDLSGATRGGPGLLALAGVLGVAMFFARDATLLSRGDLTAASLGVSVRGTSLALHALAAFATAVAVTQSGSVGFVGLVVPHAVRLVIGNDQRWLMPAAALAGGALLTLADTAARTLFAPAQLPVGVLTAIIGVPLFLWLLRRTAR